MLNFQFLFHLISWMIPIFLNNKIPVDVCINLGGIYAGMTQKAVAQRLNLLHLPKDV